ncbi:hypothetical protein L0222_10665 [bacterium]|nr:hypothetical protein [bacterium]MCI0606184.1 hypothetical protein [bacterium]
MITVEGCTRYRRFGRDRAEEFYSKGYKRSYFFPHRILFLPKCGPDGLKLATRMCGPCELSQIWEVVLYAESPVIDEFPQDLFFDDDLVWHQQQFGNTGQIATANIVIQGTSLYTMVHISDLVQRISRKREHKTRIENRFRGWHHLLLNAILNFAYEQKLNPIHSCSSALALKNTDPKRNVQRELFERVYDRNINELFQASRKDEWWSIDTDANRGRMVRPEMYEEKLSNGKIICLCHDVEEGFGHTEADPPFAEYAHQKSPVHLEQMLGIEKEFQVKATYNILGCVFQRVRERIESDAHCLAFHSYNHGIDDEIPFQLVECRKIDYRIKGYRPPQSKITEGLNDYHLAFHNFEWLASSVRSLGFREPKMINRLVKLPVLFDDFAMYKEGMRYEDWEKGAIQKINEANSAIFCLHDCYAHQWLPYYRGFLEKISKLGKLKTLNEVAAQVTLNNAC